MSSLTIHSPQPGLVYGDISWRTESGMTVNCSHGTVMLPNCAYVSGLQVGANAVIVYLEKDNHNEMMVSTNDKRSQSMSSFLERV